MLNPTKHTLQKLELLFEELGYAIRYEKGNFQSGYCVVEHRSVAVINKFFDVEARISTLLDILDQIEVEEDGLSDKSRKLWRMIQAIKAGNTTEEEEEEPVTEPEAPQNPPGHE